MPRHHALQSWTVVALAALLALGPLPASHALGGLSASATPLNLAPHPASLGLSSPLPDARLPGSSGPNYDEQLGFTFTQTFSSLEYNVTALAQADAQGYGPAYLLNGVTPSNYWYQVGISYHWPDSNGNYDPTFGFSYEVYGPDAKPVYPASGGAGLSPFSTTVNSGDIVLLSLTFSGSSVVMTAKDWSTGATASATYSSVGSSTFVGDSSAPADSSGFFTGLMTEWYHVSAYTGNEGEVIYSNPKVAVNSAWLWMDEYNPEATGSGADVFADQSPTPISFTDPQQLYPLSSDGATIYGSSTQFITGLLSADHSKVTLIPAASTTAAPEFVANYTLAGSSQSSAVSPGGVVEADPGTSITVTINETASSPSEQWVFAGSGASAVTSVTFAAGTNITYAYYQLVEQTVSYQVVGGTLPATSSPELTYLVPPATASATASEFSATQSLGTSPVEIFAVGGTLATLNGNIQGSPGERWATSTQNWTLSSPNVIPDPIGFYHQYETSIEYSVAGGGTLPVVTEFNSTSFGSPTVVQLVAGTASTGYFDVGSSYSLTGTITGAAGERWLANDSAPATISVPNAAISEVYVHQYYATLGVNDPAGGSVSEQSGWVDAGNDLRVNATASNRWQFEMWMGSGPGYYNGTHSDLNLVMQGPVTENATFYTQFVITPDVGTNVAYSYSGTSGTVNAGNASFLYVPPGTNVTLHASPATFIYSFASWRGTGIANGTATKPTLSLIANGPIVVTNTSSYNIPILLALAIAPLVAILIVAAWFRSYRRKRASVQGFSPG